MLIKSFYWILVTSCLLHGICHLILVTWYLLPDTSHLICVTWILLPDTYFLIFVTLHLFTCTFIKYELWGNCYLILFTWYRRMYVTFNMNSIIYILFQFIICQKLHTANSFPKCLRRDSKLSKIKHILGSKG